MADAAPRVAAPPVAAWRPAGRPLAPVVKWPGSKRSLSPWLGALFPPAARRYVEPFVGGGAMLPLRPAGPALAGDIVAELIRLWLAIRDRPDETAEAYERRWNRLRREGRSVYYSIRQRFNATRDPHDLLFLSRTCVNGLVRFNAAGEFNNSLHHTRPGIAPERLRRVIDRWSRALRGVDFVAADYRESLAGAGRDDFVFLDPPYAGTRGRYHPGRFDLEALFAELDHLNRVGARWILTLDGVAGPRTYAAAVPPELWLARVALPSGNSPFTKLMRTGVDRVVEAVYLNYEPPAEVFARLPVVSSIW